MQVAFSFPLVRILSHPAVCGPICASHGYDLQYFSEKGNPSAPAHVGPPSANIEIKLSGVEDAAVEKGSDPIGEVFCRSIRGDPELIFLHSCCFGAPQLGRLFPPMIKRRRRSLPRILLVKDGSLCVVVLLFARMVPLSCLTLKFVWAHRICAWFPIKKVL